MLGEEEEWAPKASLSKFGRRKWVFLTMHKRVSGMENTRNEG